MSKFISKKEALSIINKNIGKHENDDKLINENFEKIINDLNILIEKSTSFELKTTFKTSFIKDRVKNIEMLKAKIENFLISKEYDPKIGYTIINDEYYLFINIKLD
jgi:hypothetical protein